MDMIGRDTRTAQARKNSFFLDFIIPRTRSLVGCVCAVRPCAIHVLIHVLLFNLEAFF